MTEPRRRILRERIAEARGFLVHLDAAIFTTFSFNPDFFQEDVLPLVLAVDAKGPAARRAQVHEALAEVPVAVFYDPSTSPKPADRYRYSACGVPLRGRFFHPKNIILAGREKNGTRWLYITATSANVTMSGWGRNAEGFAEAWVHTRNQQPCDELSSFLAWLSERTGLEGDDKNAVATIQRFIEQLPRRNRHADYGNQTWSGSLYARLYFSPNHQDGLARFMRGDRVYWGRRLIAFSPYWGAVRENVDLFKVGEAVLVPARLQRPEPTVGLQREEAATLPERVRLGINASDVSEPFWHLKGYYLEQGGEKLLALGSCNFTEAGLRGASGNVESMLVYGVNGPEGHLPASGEFDDTLLADEEQPEEEIPTAAPICIIVLYDWKLRAYRWVYRANSLHHGVVLRLPGRKRGFALRTQEGRWDNASPPDEKGQYRVDFWVQGKRGMHQWRGIIAQLNLDLSTATYGSMLSPLDILESWRGVATPIGGRAPADDGDLGEPGDQGDLDGEEPARSFDVLSLYYMYRSFSELRERLEGHRQRNERRIIKALLVGRPDSAWALTNLAMEDDSSNAIRFLVVREVRALFAAFSDHLDPAHRTTVHRWFLDLRRQVLAELQEELTATRGAQGVEPRRVLDWFERHLDRVGG